MFSNDLHRDIEAVLLTEEQIQRRIAELGAQISADYAGKELHLIGVLRGAVMFLADLMRHLTIPCSCDFIAIASYGMDTKSSGVVNPQRLRRQHSREACAYREDIVTLADPQLHPDLIRSRNQPAFGCALWIT
jgi:hypoxanthine phosphoribosyltransferase (EC 2.4.2.8)